jgi:hypothetical protein
LDCVLTDERGSLTYKRDGLTLEALLDAGFVDADMLRPFESSLVADDQLFIYRFD